MSTPILMTSPYAIEFPDISAYQNYNQYSQPTAIDWAKVASHPKVRGVMVKCSEGTWIGYPEGVALDQMNRANAVGLHVIPYHFWSYNVDPAGQAANFKRVWGKANFKPKRFMVDIEDCSDQEARPPTEAILEADYPLWIPKARKIAGSVKATLDAVAQSTGVAPIWYGGEWYQGWWTWMATMDGVDMSWIKLYPHHCASYTAPWMYLCTGFTLEQTLFWQWTSSPPEDKQIDGFPYKERIDMNYWLKSEAEFYEFMGADQPGGEVTPPPETGGVMAGTYKIDVAQELRGTFIPVTDEDKSVDIAGVGKYANAVMLKIGGSDGVIGSGQELYAESAWPIRVAQAKAAGVPIIGLVNLSAAYHLWKEHEENILEKPYAENKILEMVMRAWRSVPLDYSNLSATDGKWQPVKALVFWQYERNMNDGRPIPEPWFRITLQYALKFLDIWRKSGAIPNIPIYVMGTDGFFSDFRGDYGTALTNMKKNGMLSGCGIIHPVFETAPVATPFANLGEALAFRPGNDFKYSYVPYGYEEATVFHLYTYGRLLSPEFKDKDGNLSPISACAWCDTPTEMGKTLGFTPVIPPGGEEGGGEEGGGTIPPGAAAQIASFLRYQAAEMVKLAEVLESL